MLGYTVVLTSRDPKAGAAAAAELKAAGCDVHSVNLEVTNPEDIKKLVQYLQTTFGKLDVLVNNAGIALEWNGEPTNADKIRRTLEVNLIAPFAITEALVPLLSLSQDARVINHSSMLGSIGSAESGWSDMATFMSVGYSTSKAGLNMLTLIQSKTLESKGIAVAAAHPGWVKTDMGTQAAPILVHSTMSLDIRNLRDSKEEVTPEVLALIEDAVGRGVTTLEAFEKLLEDKTISALIWV